MVGLGQAEECLTLRAEERRQTPDVGRMKCVRQSARDDGSILERVPGSRRRLSAVRKHPPSAVGRARQVHCEQMKIGTLRYLDSSHGPQKGRIRKEQGGRKVSICNQSAIPIDVFENQIEQMSPLNDAFFN